MSFARLVLAAPAVALVFSAAACGSATPDPNDSGLAPEAAPLTMIGNAQAAAAPSVVPRQDERSLSRVLAYVNGEVVNYRDVLLRVGPQLAVVDSAEERTTLEQRALIDILRERIVDQAAREAGVDVQREELDNERWRRSREIERSGGSLDAYLAERGMTRREFDEQIRREIRMARYLRAAMGSGGEASVVVRAMTDTYPSPREMRDWYERNREKPPIRVPDLALVRVLAIRADVSAGGTAAAASLADARSRAEQALARLKAGEDFVPVFRDVHRDAAEPDPNDGLLELAERGKKVAWIEEFAFHQPRGTLSEVLQKGNTFYVLRAEGFTPAHTRPYEEASDDVRSLLGRAKRVVASYEVELSLLEESAVTPKERYDALREFLGSTRRRIIDEAGL